MAAARNNRPELFVTVSDDAYVELSKMLGQRILGFTVWDETLSDEVENPTENSTEKTTVDTDVSLNGHAHASIRRGDTDGDEPGADDKDAVDIDIYLEGGIYFELYGTLCYPTLDSEPLLGTSTIRNAIADLVNSGVWLDDVAVDDEEQLVLVLSQHRKPQLYLSVGGWLVEEWDELPN